MSSIIESMLEERERELRAAREERAAKEKEATEILLTQMKVYLGDFWTIIEEHARATETPYLYTVSDGRISYPIPVLHDHKLAPIEIRWDKNSSLNGYHSRYDRFRIAGRSYQDLAEALAAAREEYPRYVESEKQKRLEFFKSEISYNWNGSKKTEEEIRELISQVKAEFPDKAEKADQMLADWLEHKAEEIRREEKNRREDEEREAAQALAKTIRIGFVQKLAEWLDSHDRVYDTNQKLAAQIQATSDSRPYNVYKLTYSLLATDESEEGLEKYIEARSVYTLYAVPDPFGFWDLNGKRVKVYNPVSLELLSVKASSGILSKDIERGGVTLSFPPDMIDAMIEEIVSEIQDLPKEPEAPKECEDFTWNKGAYYSQARKLLEGGAEIPDPDSLLF